MKKINKGELNSLTFVQETKNNSDVANSMEVISGGKLSDIARPSVSSRGSARSLSQLSMQSKASFELEALPVEKDLPIWSKHDDIFLEDAFCDMERSEIVESYSSKLKANSFEKQTDEDDNELLTNPFGSTKKMHKISKRAVKSRKPATIVSDDSVEPAPLEEASHARDSVESGNRSLNADAKRATGENKQEDEIPPKIKRGLEKIRKLDDILAEKVKLEKEVKADRKRMEKEWQVEIKGFLEWCGDNASRPAIQQFLNLTNGIGDEDKFKFCDLDEDFNPVFATELDQENVEKSETTINDSGSIDGTVKGELELGDDRDKKGSNSEIKAGRKKKKKDFLKRNKELAGHANEVIALTEEERLRLDELLIDDSDLLSFENPFSKHTKVIECSGYELDKNSKLALNDIDEKLKLLVPETDFQSICSTPLFDKMSLSHRSLGFSEHSVDKSIDVKCKEPALQEGKDFRDMASRLRQIELELGRMDELKDGEFMSETPRITHELLRQLIDVDDRLTSSALSILDSSQSQLTHRTLTPTSMMDHDILLDSHESDSDKRFCNVGV
eukprot:gene20129-22101_t